jgi:hypothetical protein
VHALQRVARAVVAQGDELLGLADRGRERHAALLVAAGAGQGDSRETVAPREHRHVRGRPGAHQAPHQTERVGAGERDAGELDPPAPPRLEGELDGARPPGS